MDEIQKKHPAIIRGCQYFLGDKGYDDGKLIRKLWDDHGIKPIIDIRNMWHDDEETKLVIGRTSIVYDHRGTVYCYCLEAGQMREMANGGFAKDRETLKCRYPVNHYGIECKSKDSCPVESCLRIPLSEDRRTFTPISRSSYKWERLYKKRTAVEQVNSG